MIETAAERAEREAELLAGLREQYPDRDFHDLHDGWLVLPEGTQYVFARNLAALPGKLAEAGRAQ